MENAITGWALHQVPAIALCAALWWLERQERLKLEQKLEDCLEARVREAQD